MKKFKIIGSHLCPVTLHAIVKCKDKGLVFNFIDLSSSLNGLKIFLSLHEHDNIYTYYREMSKKNDYLENGKIGLPCFIFEDGFKTLELSEAIEKAQEE